MGKSLANKKHCGLRGERISKVFYCGRRARSSAKPLDFKWSVRGKCRKCIYAKAAIVRGKSKCIKCRLKSAQKRRKAGKIGVTGGVSAEHFPTVTSGKSDRESGAAEAHLSVCEVFWHLNRAFEIEALTALQVAHRNR